MDAHAPHRPGISPPHYRLPAGAGESEVCTLTRPAELLQGTCADTRCNRLEEFYRGQTVKDVPPGVGELSRISRHEPDGGLLDEGLCWEAIGDDPLSVDFSVHFKAPPH